jgi:hypothetical protein
MDGATLFARFALPPNELGYCGPTDGTLIAELLQAEEVGLDELRHTATAFAGAWPYLELIAGCHGLDPLDPRVVEAYWVGNRLLDSVDTLTWGNALQDRFSGGGTDGFRAITDALLRGGVPSHAFHVFCVYPWVGLLRSRTPGPALRILDLCRIRVGRVVGKEGAHLIAESRHLELAGAGLRLGAPRIESALPRSDPTLSIDVGDLVALHWSHVCDVITASQMAYLRALEDLHLTLANDQTLGTRIVEV